MDSLSKIHVENEGDSEIDSKVSKLRVNIETEDSIRL